MHTCSMAESFVCDGETWVKYDFPTTENYASGNLAVSIPQIFANHISACGSEFCLDVYEAISQCVSGRSFQPSTTCSLGSAQRLLSSWLGFKRQASGVVDRPAVVERLYMAKPDDERIGLFFSGGVDSTFTLSWLREKTDKKIVALSLIHSADGRPDETQLRVFKETKRTLEKFNVELIYASTNIMSHNPRISDLWAFATHGACHAAIGHLLSARVDRWFLSSTHDFSALMPWGSHPLLDPLFSSDDVLISHFGAEFTRFQKIQGIVAGGLGFSSLSVCGKGPQAGAHFNCSKCQKCIRTMVALDLCDAKDRAHSFDWSKYSSSSFAGVTIKGENEIVFANELLREAKHIGRSDLSSAIGASIKKSTLYKFIYRAERAMRLKFPEILRVKPVLKKVKALVYR